MLIGALTVAEWKPINTSPMNLEVLISDGQYVYAAICRYQGGEPNEDWMVPMASCGYRAVINRPTHWMPMPDPPSQSDAKPKQGD